MGKVEKLNQPANQAAFAPVSSFLLREKKLSLIAQQDGLVPAMPDDGLGQIEGNQESFVLSSALELLRLAYPQLEDRQFLSSNENIL